MEVSLDGTAIRRCRRLCLVSSSYASELIKSTELDAEKRLALQEEKQDLEHKLLEVPKMRTRLEELKAVKAERERAA